MLCIDTSSLIAYLEGARGPDVDLVDQAFSDEIGTISPVTLTEVLSDPRLGRPIRETILQLPVLPILDGFWERAGALRAGVLRTGHKARLADTLIAQNCLDHHAALVTRDRDFRHLARVGGLRLLSDFA
ncbi:MAG: PIN domain-containing protein [Nitrospiria bacterium]